MTAVLLIGGPHDGMHYAVRGKLPSVLRFSMLPELPRYYPPYPSDHFLPAPVDIQYFSSPVPHVYVWEKAEYKTPCLSHRVSAEDFYRYGPAMKENILSYFMKRIPQVDEWTLHLEMKDDDETDMVLLRVRALVFDLIDNSLETLYTMKTYNQGEPYEQTFTDHRT